MNNKYYDMIIFELSQIETDKDFYRVMDSINNNPDYSVDDINRAREAADCHNSSQYRPTFFDKKKGFCHYVRKTFNSFEQVQFIEYDGKVWKQIFNDRYEFIEDFETKYEDEWSASKERQEKGLTGIGVNVLRSQDGDCTNGGISSEQNELYLLSERTMPFQPKYLEQCITVVKRNLMNETYVHAEPVINSGKHHMAGGNFAYTGDSRYREITGIYYPISIHDRVE